MKIKVLLYLPKEQEEIMVDVPDKSSTEQANFIANTIKQQYPDYYRWGTISWVVDWPKEMSA